MTNAASLNSEAIEVSFHHPGAEPQPSRSSCSSQEKIVITNTSTYPLDFTDHVFRCDSQRSYTFSDFVNHVEPGAEVQIAGGRKSHSILQRHPPIYIINTGLVPHSWTKPEETFSLETPKMRSLSPSITRIAKRGKRKSRAHQNRQENHLASENTPNNHPSRASYNRPNSSEAKRQAHPQS